MRLRKREGQAIADAAALGAVAGMRSTWPVAFLSFAVKRRRFPRLTRPAARAPLALAAGSEWIYDKLPSAGSRLQPPALLARLGSGAVAGAIAARALRTRAWVGAVAGGLAALASSFVFHRLRGLSTTRTGWSSTKTGLLEDALAAGVASVALRGMRT
jgi:uncharacterized membrane protein